MCSRGSKKNIGRKSVEHNTREITIWFETISLLQNKFQKAITEIIKIRSSQIALSYPSKRHFLKVSERIEKNCNGYLSLPRVAEEACCMKHIYQYCNK